MGRRALAPALISAALLLAGGEAPRAARSGPAWTPGVHAAIAYASHRRGIIAFAVRTPDRAWGWHARTTFPSASVLKAMLLVAYLRRGDVAHRHLRGRDRALLAPMIRRSDNTAASRVLGIVGTRALRRLARRAGMHRFRPVANPWGFSRIDAEDQARYFLHIDGLMPREHRAYGMHLLAAIVPSQRWGIGRVAPAGWRLYFKGGWGSGIGWVDHQVALLTRRPGERVAVAILTHLDGSHPYGKATLRGIAARLLRGLAHATRVS